MGIVIGIFVALVVAFAGFLFIANPGRGRWFNP